ncbi:MAG TPA: carboxypeptidase regulatory-like domain-containing protein [Pyrinomonadaceae bacterium]
MISVGILSFQDESGTNTPSESGQKIAQELQQKLVVGYKDLLPRVISAGPDATEIKGLTVDQLVALGKQNGLKFIVRGGLLAVNSESAGEDTKVNIQFYAEIASVETANVSSVRAEGIGARKGPAPDTTAQLGSADFRSNEFRASALGQALSSAIEQLAASIHQAVTAPAATPSGPTQTATETSQAATTDAQAAQAAETDAELQQLIAQAEALLAGNSTSSTETLSALSQALEGVKTALASKTSLMEQSQDTTQADQQIAAHQQELQAAMTKAMEEAATSETTSAEAQPSGEKKGFMARIDDFAGQSLSLLQKIQEMRAALRGFKEEQSSYPTGEAGDPGTEAAMPSEGSVEEVTGVITEDGSPVEGAIVTDEESGLSTTTDSSGSYALKGLLSGKLAKLTISKGLKKMTAQVEVFARRANVADLQFKPLSTGSVRPALTVLPSTVVINAIRSVGAPLGQVRGVVRDALGNPVARALVTLRVLGTARTSSPDQETFPGGSMSAHHVNRSRTKLTHSPETLFGQMPVAQTSKSIGVARTNSLGQYAFLNVPTGAYQLTINHSGQKLKTAQVQVGQRKVAEANFKFTQSDAIARLPMSGRTLILPGAATALRGTVLDDQNHPVAGAKVSAVQSDSVISVFTGMKGTFELRNLKPGLYRVTIFKVGYYGANQQVALRPGGVEQAKFQLKKQSSPMIAGLLRNESIRRSENQKNERRHEPSGDTRISRTEITHGTETLARKGQLAGNITDAANGKPLSGVSVSLPGQPSTKTDQQGNYRFEPLAPGSYQVSAKLNGYTPETRAITVRSGSSARQDIALRSERRAMPSISGEIRKPPVVIGGIGIRDGQVTGQVIDSKSGRPISGANVSASAQRTTTNAQGRFVFANLAPGSYRISVGRSGFSSAQATIAVRAGETATANFKLDPSSVPPVRLRIP